MVVGRDGPAMTLRRTVKLPTQDVDAETLQPLLKASLGIEE